MADFRQCDFFLLRYVPDVVKGEFVNVGVVLLENASGDGGPSAGSGQVFTDVRFTRDWRRVRCLDPEVDIELMESYEAELRRLLESRVAGDHQLSRADVAARVAAGADAGIVLRRAGAGADERGADRVSGGGVGQAGAGVPGVRRRAGGARRPGGA